MWGEWVFRKDQPASEEVACWQGYPPVKPSEFQYLGIPTFRGIKVAAVAASRVMTDPEALASKMFIHHVYPAGAIAGSAFAQAREIQFMGLPGVRTDEALIGSVSELGDVLSTVNDLAFQVEEDEFGLVRPSYHAHRQCLRVLLALAQKSEFIKPSEIGTDRNGDIRISWAGEGREIELVCPSEEAESPYIYFSSAETYGTETDISADGLLSKIRWARGGE